MRLLAILSVIGLIILFLPWTQNIRAGGQVTALQPDQRPQTLHSVIPGRIENGLSVKVIWSERRYHPVYIRS